MICYGNAFGAGERIQAGTAQLREFIFGTELTFSGEANVTAVIQPALVFIPQSEKGQPGGVATLGPDGKVLPEQLPEMDYIPTSEKGNARGVAVLDSSGKLVKREIPDIDCGGWDTDPVAEHDSAPAAHRNLLVDGNNAVMADHSETLEEHIGSPMAHQNLIIDGNAGQ